MARRTSNRPPPEVVADLTDLLVACPAFHGLDRAALGRLAGSGEIGYLGAAAEPVTTALVVMRGGIYVHDTEGHTIDVVAEGEYAALAAGETVSPVESALVVWLGADARDLAWSAPAEDLPRLVTPSRPSVDLQLAAVRTIMRSPVHTARPDETCREVAQRMSTERISSVLLEIGGDIGIATDRDLRTRLVAQGRSPDTPIGEIATAPARVIDAATPIFEALVEMLSTGIHHLPVVESGRLVGMLSSGDLNQLGARSPLQVRVAVDRAADVEGVAAALGGLPDMVGALMAAGTDAGDVGRVIATVTDRVQRRVFALIEDETGPPPTAYGWVAYGSQARREQTLLSDQDHGLVLADEASADGQGGGGVAPELDAWWADYAERAVSALERCGYPRCGGNVMAANSHWRHTVSGWQREYRALIDRPSAQHVMESSIAFDLRTVAGELQARDLMAPTLATAQRSGIFLAHLARSAVGHRPPLGFLGRLAVKRSGEHTGSFDVKAGGMLPIADLARLATLARGGAEVSTDDRLAAAGAEGVVSADLASTLRSGYELAMRLRLRRHLDQHRVGAPLDNWLDPSELEPMARSQLRETFKAVRVAQENLAMRYRTDVLG